MPEADLWFWDVADTVHEVASKKLLDHARPFEDDIQAGHTAASPIEAALDKAKSEDRVLVLGLHGGRAENGELQADVRNARDSVHRLGLGVVAISPSTRWRPSVLPRLRACTAPAGVALENLDAAFAEYGRLIAKPARDGSSYGLIFVNAKQDLVAVRNAAPKPKSI